MVRRHGPVLSCRPTRASACLCDTGNPAPLTAGVESVPRSNEDRAATALQFVSAYVRMLSLVIGGDRYRGRAAPPAPHAPIGGNTYDLSNLCQDPGPDGVLSHEKRGSMEHSTALVWFERSAGCTSPHGILAAMTQRTDTGAPLLDMPELHLHRRLRPGGAFAVSRHGASARKRGPWCPEVQRGTREGVETAAKYPRFARTRGGERERVNLNASGDGISPSFQLCSGKKYEPQPASTPTA